MDNERFSIIIFFSYCISFALIMVLPWIIAMKHYGIFKYNRDGTFTLCWSVGLILHGIIFAIIGVISMAFTSLLTGFFILIPFRLFFYKTFKQDYLVYKLQKEKTGVETTATIVNVRETGQRLNERPIIKLELEYSFEGKTFTGEVKRAFLFTDLYFLQPGNSLSILINPKNPKKFGLLGEYQ